jgi:thiol:disulfide interchange protein DsbD
MKVGNLLSRLLAAAFAVAPLAATAQGPATITTEHSRATLMAERATLAPGERLWVALKLELDPGWHTYWRNPGDSGLPGDIAWTLPPGVTAGPIQWPTPERAPYGPLMNFGFHDRVILPVELSAAPDAAAGPGVIRADANWLVCADVCIPDQGTLELPLTIAAGAPGDATAEAAEIAAALAALPRPAPWPVSIARAGTQWQISAGPGVTGSVSDAFFFPDTAGLIENVAPQPFAVNGGTLTLAANVDPFAKQFPPTVSGVLTLTTDGATAAYTVSAPVTVAAAANAAAAAVAADAADVGLLAALAFAFIGGLILNLMPCVLPVLAMKAVSLAKARDTARVEGFAFTAGVMLTFAVLALILAALRQSGTQWGWGFQLQEPVFVTVMAAIVLALGLMLSGVFTVGGGIMGVGQGLTSKGGPLGAFFTGALAVVVATPCTAPFMGTAMMYALTQPTATALAVFQALALGMAAPFLIVSVVPALARAIPKPGPWMEPFKQVLAFPMYATAAWLVWVLAQQVGPDGLAAGLAVLVLTAFAGWAWGQAQASARGTVAALVGVAAAIGALALLPPIENASRASAPAAVAATEGRLAPEPYSEARLAELRGQGRPVFVNFTAAWCITCLMNERVTLSNDGVIAAMTAANVAYLKADWTNRDAAIGAALASYGRSGVPLYLFFPAGADKPLILPQIITPSDLVAAAGAAGGGDAARVAGR